MLNATMAINKRKITACLVGPHEYLLLSNAYLCEQTYCSTKKSKSAPRDWVPAPLSLVSVLRHLFYARLPVPVRFRSNQVLTYRFSRKIQRLFGGFDLNFREFPGSGELSHRQGQRGAA